MKSEAKVVGTVVDHPLDQVRPNTWNPNEMTPEQEASVRQGFLEDGWLSSQALLIWGTDKRGKRKDVIIDGEHRWKIACSLGMKSGPMVFLKGLSEADAKALTVKLDNKRGKFNKGKLADVLRYVVEDGIGVEDVALSLGFGQEELLKLTAMPEIPLVGQAPPDAGGGGIAGEGVTSTNSHVKMVPLYFAPADHERFMAKLKELSAQYGTENVTDTVIKAVLG